MFAATSEGIIDQIVAQLKKELDANIEEVTHAGSHLGIQIILTEDGSITLTQPGYITRMAETLGQDKGPIALTPTPINSIRPDNSPSTDITRFQQVIGLLMFTSVHTRPDISFAVLELAIHATAPTEYDLQQAYRGGLQPLEEDYIP